MINSMFRKLSFMKNSNKGFSLVEIIVASILLAIICAGIFSVSASSKKIVSVTSQRHEATEVAQAVLENLRSYLNLSIWENSSSLIWPTGSWNGWYTFSDVSNSLTTRISNVFSGSEFATKYQGRWRFKIDDPDGAGPFEYRKATVEVNWTEVTM
jgi:prepilin-type N-terminal cleavage/methylation domain-containing protein